MLWFNAVYELPFGRDKRFLNDMHPVANAVLGGWQLSAINSFISGAPLSISVPGATLGNGWGTRANLVGDPDVSDPSATGWFDPAAFAAPAQFEYGTSPIGVIEGPAAHMLDLGLMKRFSDRPWHVPADSGRSLQCAEQGEPRQPGDDARHRELRAYPERGRAHGRCSLV